MIAILYWVFIGLIPCRHKWKVVETVKTKDDRLEYAAGQTFKKTYHYTQKRCQCTKCGEWKTFTL